MVILMEKEKLSLEIPTSVPPPGKITDSSPRSAPHDCHGEKERVVGLDGLRGIAACGVLIHHFTTSYDVNYSFKGWLPFTFPQGVWGVPLFFLISGFVIFMTVERTKLSRDFAVSRFVRLYPGFWLSLLIALVILCVIPGPDQPLVSGRLLRRATANASMISGWFGIGMINHDYWTLSVEMTFYVIFFLLLFWKRIDWTVPVLCGFVVLGMVDGLIARQWPNPVSPYLRSILALDHIHVFLMGVLLYKMRRSIKPVYAIVFLLCAAAPFTQLPHRFYAPVRDTSSVFVLALILYLASTGRLRFLQWRPLVFVGTISYALYLNHHVMGTRIIYHAQRYGFSPSVSIVLATIASFLLGAAITFWFERPVSAALRHRIATWRSNRSQRPLIASITVPGYERWSTTRG
jgi:peptidoglycan/LPS O-acetylase OafA/YrhL